METASATGGRSYAYDSANQLIRENNQAANKTWTWEYDSIGNILCKKEYAYTTGALGTPVDTIEYGYDSEAWGQLLTSYDGHALHYDSDDGGYTPSMSHNEKYYMMWDRGHKLVDLYDEQSLYQYTDYYYSYDANGMRTKQTIVVSDDENDEYQTSVYEYTYNGSQLSRMAYRGTEDRYTMDFRYDANGTPLSVYFTHIAYWDGGMYTCCDEVYYYITNLQGDVIAIVDCWGDTYATYTYDAWGRPLSAQSGGCIGDVNPLRYRGYVYDIDTGFYYLQSRYYDPVKGRFISPDGQISGVGGEILGNNQFAYCFNNPVNMSDSSGNWPKWLSGALNVVSGVAQAALGAALGATVGWTGIGAAAAATLVVNGAATATQGIGQIVNAATQANVMREDNIVRTGVQETGRVIGGDDGAAIARTTYDIAVAAASVYAGKVISTPSACFAAGTAILTSLGERAIEEICAGDLVWAEDAETGEISLKEVIQTFVRESDAIVCVFVQGEEIVTTPEHPFYVPNKGWVAAGILCTGDVLLLQNGDYAIIEGIQHKTLESPIKVYNFEVADFHTYFVGKSSVLVHNTCQKFTADQQTVIELAREYRNGLSRSEAEIMVNWAREYGLRNHGPMIHPNRSGIWGFTEHIKIFNEHIPIK